ncbi:MAG: hypothetical protein JWP25_8988 [Bradyrhizobium sp.]|nr:hypothetical protein [Bradyrhizobium sp.]
MADDSWRDGYDAWKLREPDWDDEPEDECEHEEYEVDILVGRAHCCRCPHSWWQTNEEIAAETRRIADYYEWQRQQESRWFQFKERMRSWWRSIWQRRKRPAKVVDDIPF